MRPGGGRYPNMPPRKSCMGSLPLPCTPCVINPPATTRRREIPQLPRPAGRPVRRGGRNLPIRGYFREVIAPSGAERASEAPHLAVLLSFSISRRIYGCARPVCRLRMRRGAGRRNPHRRPRSGACAPDTLVGPRRVEMFPSFFTTGPHPPCRRFRSRRPNPRRRVASAIPPNRPTRWRRR